MCRDTVPSGANCCNACARKLKGIFAAKDSVIDSGLARAISIGRSYEREQSVRSLARTLCKPPEKLAAKLEQLKRENKVMRERVRRLNNSKATLGFKSKAPKASNSAAQRKSIFN